jgi:hypothetical protein
MYFPSEEGEIAFYAKLPRTRFHEQGLRVSLALLKLGGKSSQAIGRSTGWRPAKVITGPEWKQLATNLVEALTPKKVNRGVYYRGLVGDHFLYR